MLPPFQPAGKHPMPLSRTLTRTAIAAALLTAALAACGGGGDAAPPPSDPPPAATLGTAGIFDVNYGQFRGTYAFLDDGRFYGVHFVAGSMLAGHPHGRLSAANATGAMEPIAWANFIDDERMVGAQEPHGLFGRSFGPSALAVKISGSMGTFTSTATVQKAYAAGDKRTLYGDPLPMPAVAGAYAGKVRTVGIEQPEAPVSAFAVAADGQVSATAVDCSFSGTMAPHGRTGLFDVHLQPGGAACRFSAPLNGIVVPLSVGNGTHQLAFELDTDDNRQTAVFIVDKR